MLAQMEIVGKLDCYPQQSKQRNSNDARFYVVIVPSFNDSEIQEGVLKTRVFSTAQNKYDRTAQNVSGTDRIGGYCVYCDNPRAALNGAQPGDTVKCKVIVYPINLFTQNRNNPSEIRHSAISSIHMELDGPLAIVKAPKE